MIRRFTLYYIRYTVSVRELFLECCTTCNYLILRNTLYNIQPKTGRETVDSDDSPETGITNSENKISHGNYVRKD
jgi:hypothetical protein